MGIGLGSSTVGVCGQKVQGIGFFNFFLYVWESGISWMHFGEREWISDGGIFVDLSQPFLRKT